MNEDEKKVQRALGLLKEYKIPFPRESFEQEQKNYLFIEATSIKNAIQIACEQYPRYVAYFKSLSSADQFQYCYFGRWERTQLSITGMYTINITA